MPLKNEKQKAKNPILPLSFFHFPSHHLRPSVVICG